MRSHATQSSNADGHNTRRRQTLFGVIALSLATWTPGWARVAGQAAKPSADGAKRFIEFSELATGHQQLDPKLGATLFTALVKHDRAFTSKLALLDQFAQRNRITDVESLDAALQDNPLRADLKGIVAAWYTGAVGVGPKAQEVTYAEALMYRPSADGSHNPSFCAGATNSWETLTRPPLDVLPKS
jgi:fructose 5-dehydrogenase small subunit